MSGRRFQVAGSIYETAADETGIRVAGPGAWEGPVRVRRLDAATYEVTDSEDRWRRQVHVIADGERLWVFTDGEVFEIGTRAVARTSHASEASAMLEAPMPATVVRVMVEPGRTVTRGETVIVLEAMKMELPLRAPTDGVVEAVRCREGELVRPGAPLVELAASESPV